MMRAIACASQAEIAAQDPQYEVLRMSQLADPDWSDEAAPESLKCPQLSAHLSNARVVECSSYFFTLILQPS